MKLYVIVGMLCIAGMVITATINGIDTGVVTGGVTAIGSICTGLGLRAWYMRNNNVDAVRRGLKKAGYSDKYITRVTNKLSGGK